MVPPAASSGSGKRKDPHDDNASANNAKHQRISPQDSEDDTSGMNEVIHDGSMEPFPQRPAYDKGLYDVYKKNKKLAEQLLAIFDKHAHVSKELQNMQTKAREAVNLPVPDRVMVALVGGTGAGKSSLTSRLADEPNLAKELSAGESCTSVPTLYMHRLPWQTTGKYAAEIQYYTISKCRELLEELLRQYNFFTFEADEDWTKKQRNEYNQQANTAFDTFRFLFRNQVAFCSQESTEQELDESYKNNGTKDLINKMVGWCESFFESFTKDEDNGAGYTRCQGTTMEELREQLDPLTTPNYFIDESSLWPLVQKLSVGIPSSRVFQYITIVDLAGITDTNKLRVDTTNDYIRKCQALWYVADVARICDDPILEETMSNYAERFRGTFAIIATKIDCGLTLALANDMQLKGQDVLDYHEAKENIDDHQARMKEIRKLSKTTTGAAKTDLRDEMDELEELIKVEETKRMDCLVDARNLVIATRLRHDKQRHLPEGAVLPIHFVSNTQYDMHVEREDEPNSASKFGNIRATGIPGLREYALILAAPSVWEAYKHHLMFKVRVLFCGVYGWAQDVVAPGAKRQASLMDVVNSTSNHWTAGENAVIHHMAEVFDSGIVQKLRLANQGSYKGLWKYYGKIINQPWSHSSFLAFFRKDGKHTTHAIGTESWNEQFIRCQTRDVLDPAWREHLPQPELFFDEPISKLMTCIEDLPKTLERMPGSVSLPITAFKSVLKAQLCGIEAAHRKHKQDYTQSLANTKLDATLDQHTGHFTQAMLPCYAGGKEDKGKGVCARQRARLHHHFSNNDPIGEATKRLSEALKGNVNYHARALRCDLNKIFADITHQFKLILKRGAETSREKLARREIFTFLVGAMPGMNRIESELNTIRQRYA